jgi:penicillin-insensitive murein endopeptidase
MAQDRALAFLSALLLVSCAEEAASPATAQPSEPATTAVRAAAPTSPSVAEPAPAPTPVAEATLPAAITTLLALPLSTSLSLRGPNDGALERAVAFPLEGPGFRYNPRRRPEARFGAVEVVQALVRAALVVHRTMPGGELTVNDLGFEEGGPISQHDSHQAGRDVDVLFYLFDASGAPFPSVGAPLDPAGEGVDFRDLAVAEDDVPVRIDAARTFRFVQALLEDEDVAVQRIFVAEHIRSILLEAARSSGAPAEVIARFEDVTCPPGAPHDDHLHVRFFCAPDDVAGGCQDSNPIYPWQREALRALGLAPSRARPRRNRPRATTTTASEARAAAGPMHPDVIRWLEKREAWLDTPHPGRRYCR